LHFSQPQADAGEVRSGTPLTHRFAFVNQGPDAVEIVETRAGCGCLTPTVARRLYQPGDEGCVLLEVNTLSQAAGAHTWAVQVRWRHGTTDGDIGLQLAARVVSEVSVQPAAVMIRAETAVGYDVVLTDRRPRPLTVTAAHTSNPRLQANQVGKAVDDQGRHAYTIHLTVAADYPDGRHDEVLSIYTDDPAYRELRVMVTILKRSRQRLAATPREVTLTAPPGQPIPSRIVLIRDADNQAVFIGDIFCDDPAITCKWAPGPGTAATLRIHVDHRRLAGDGLRSAVHVRIGQPVQEILTIPISGAAP
jgi:hypothetical protein